MLGVIELQDKLKEFESTSVIKLQLNTKIDGSKEITLYVDEYGEEYPLYVFRTEHPLAKERMGRS